MSVKRQLLNFDGWVDAWEWIWGKIPSIPMYSNGPDAWVDAVTDAHAANVTRCIVHSLNSFKFEDN